MLTSPHDAGSNMPESSPRAAFAWLLLVGAAALLFASPVRAGVVVPDASDDPAQPTPTLLTLVSQQVDVSIIDQVARTTLVQVFRNDTPAPIAGTYLLPLSERASVQEYAFYVEGRRVVSQVQATPDAEKTFEDAAGRGEHAGILQQRDPNTFSARFTELAPGETRRFEVIYSELLPYEAGLVRYSHPMDYGSTGLPAVEELQVRVRIEESKPVVGTPRTSLPSTSRPIPGGVLVESAIYGAVPVGDYELEYALRSSDFGLAFRTYADGDDEGFFVAMVAPQEDTDDADVVRKDVAFVFDVSGSMDGTKIDQARSALKACLNLMNPGDGLHIVAFNDSLNPWRTGIRELDEASRQDATRFVDGLVAGGGTNIYGAVNTALTTLSASERPTAIVFLTDGLGSRSPADTLEEIERNNPDDRTRIFAFGVGSDVNRVFLERMGRENRGGFTNIDGSVAIDEVVAQFYSQISRPVLTDLALDFGPDITPNRSYPADTPDVYAGQRLVITGRYRGTGASTLTVTGRIGGKEARLELPVRFGDGTQAIDNEHPWVGRLWAKRRAEHLLADIRMYGESPEAKDEVIALSTEWQFATIYTSLVAHADPRVASLTPARIKPGDPVLKIPASADAVAVTAFLPFGEVKDLVFDASETVWTTRFLVPKQTNDGVYWIHVVVTESDGDTSWYRISYTVDTKAPVLRVQIDGLRHLVPGAVLALTARPIVGFLELGNEMIQSLGRDAAARAKAFVDIKQVVARIPGIDAEFVLVSDPDAEAGWHGELQLPADMEPGTYRVEVTATDVAGNRHTVVEPIEVTDAAIAAVSEEVQR